MIMKIALMALAAALIAGVVITLILLKFYKKKVDGIFEKPVNPSDLSDWSYDEWVDEWRDEWNDWDIWDEKHEGKQ